MYFEYLTYFAILSVIYFYRCSIWISHCGREEFRYLTPRELQYKRICELHFPPNMFSNEFRTKLKKPAVPVDFRIFSQEPIQIDDDEEDNDNDDVSDEGESGIVSETSSNNNIPCENDLDNQVRFVVESVSSDINTNTNGLDVANNERNIFSQSTEDESEIQTRSNVVSAVLLNNFGPSIEKSNEENSLQIEKGTPETQLHRLQVEKRSISAKSLSEEKNMSGPVLSKSAKNLTRRKRYNVSFQIFGNNIFIYGCCFLYLIKKTKGFYAVADQRKHQKINQKGQNKNCFLITFTHSIFLLSLTNLAD